MIETQTNLENYPEFGNNSSKVQPDAAKYANGFVQSDVLPAEWVNWAWSKNTKGITALNQGITSVENELCNLVRESGITPTESDSTQVLSAISLLINAAKAEAILAAHPVGSLYWTKSTENPAVTFGGGTWARIKDKFVWAAGDTDTIDYKGGQASVTLTVNHIPAHTHTMAHTHTVNNHTHSIAHSHTFTGTTGSVDWGGKHSHSLQHNSGYDFVNSVSGSSSGWVVSSSWSGSGFVLEGNYTDDHGGHSHTFTPAGTISSVTTATMSGGATPGTGGSSAANTGSYGGSQAHDNMPPYIIKYCWERTA